MGIGPSDSLIGDVVVVLPGGGVPYVIRGDSAHWMFVGESYIQSLMKGEAVVEYLQGAIQMEVLEFR